MTLKKLRMPIFMAVVGIFAIVSIGLSLTAKADVSLKSLTLTDQSGIWIQKVLVGQKVELPTGMANVVVQAVPADPKATIKVTGDSGFKDGDNTLSVLVTGSDHTTTQTYSLTLVQKKLSGWCEANKAKVQATNDNYDLADIYQDYTLIYVAPGATEAEVRANITCFSPNLQKYIATH